MADPAKKTEAPASTKAPNADAVKAQLAAASSGPEFIAIGRLRRDTMILGAGDHEAMNSLGAEAVTSGRAAEVYVVPVVGYFSESKTDFVEPDRIAGGGWTRNDATDDQPPLLNPSTGEQAVVAAKADPGDAAKAPVPTQTA